MDQTRGEGNGVSGARREGATGRATNGTASIRGESTAEVILSKVFAAWWRRADFTLAATEQQSSTWRPAELLHGRSSPDDADAF